MNWIEIGANFIEAVLETQFFVRYFGSKNNYSKKVVIALFVMIHFAAMCIFNNITYISDMELFVMLVLRFALIAFLLQGRLLEKLLIVQMDTIILQSSSILLTSLFDPIIAYDTEGYMEFGGWRIILLILAKLIYVGATELILRNQVKDKEYVSNKAYLELNVVVLALLIAFSFLTAFIYQNSLSQKIINDAKLLFFFLIIVDVMIYVLFINLTNASISLLKEQMKAASYEHRVSDVQAMKELSHQTAKINHDIKNKFVNIRVMIEKGQIEEAKRYLDETLKINLSAKNIIVTENMMVDAVLNHHLDVCEKKNINSKVQVDCIIDAHMETDVAVMLANLLDNAVEAAERTDEKEIEILIKRKSDYLSVLVKNSFDGILKKQNGKLFTIKDDERYHGYGLINVKDIVDKYDGIYEYDVEAKEFCTKIMLYIKKGCPFVQ